MDSSAVNDPEKLIDDSDLRFKNKYEVQFLLTQTCETGIKQTMVSFDDFENPSFQDSILSLQVFSIKLNSGEICLKPIDEELKQQALLSDQISTNITFPPIKLKLQQILLTQDKTSSQKTGSSKLNSQFSSNSQQNTSRLQIQQKPIPQKQQKSQRPVFKKAAAVMNNSSTSASSTPQKQSDSPPSSNAALQNSGESINRIIHQSANANSKKTTSTMFSQNISSGSKFNNSSSSGGGGTRRGNSKLKIKQLQPAVVVKSNQKSISSFTKKN
ncbi:UNKNOWN [Stylonychia lemnae]|uniref:Uncharacterized protein n=1 Tax=Stylonychia lemnae TaxID=5949 RepID=A0A078B518_STYLE|nr:UNKNOWN [Stylonychia lemnae]|eukprot:CDW89620.1 UNKNOWN [Stylonychia lemnae]